MADTHEIKFSPEEYAQAAEKWRNDLLKIPVLECKDTLKYMTVMPGVRGKLHVGAAQSNAQFAPFNAFRTTKGSTAVNYRTLETFLGDVQEEFVPNQYITTLLGQGADFFGEGQKQAPSAKLVIACAMKSLGEHLHDALFSASRNAEGDTTADLFDGWGTIAKAEIEAENIAEKLGNYLKLDDQITQANAVDVLKEIERSSDPVLRRQEKFLYCAPEVADAYNDNYLLTHTGLVYNKKFEQPILEGSNQKTTIVPITGLSGTNLAFLTPKANMLFGCDTMGDVERLEVMRTRPFVLTLAAAMFFGTQYYTLDKRLFRCIELADAPSEKPQGPPEPPKEEGGQEGDDNN